MSILILTGPVASGKNTVGGRIADLLERCAVIDVDLVRWMVLKPHKAPWEGAEGQSQQQLGVTNACLLAKNFAWTGYDTVIMDVLTNQTARQYRTELAGVRHSIVLLLPTFVEAGRRSVLRGRGVTAEEERIVYDWQQQLAEYDERIDNTELPAETVARQLVAWFKEGKMP